MPLASSEQTAPAAPPPPASPPAAPLLIGVDVGGTFTDLAAFDAASGKLQVVKVPSTPPDFQLGVLEAVRRVLPHGAAARITHGSTVATNALLQRGGEPVAFVATDGMGDMLLIGRQDRPRLYALHVERTAPLAPADHCFTVRERISAAGDVVEPLDPSEVDRLVEAIAARGLRHVAVCLLFSFVNPIHERLIADRCRSADLTVSLSSDVVPEFREYERASTTVINAALRPTVQAYLSALERDLGDAAREAPLRVMHSAGGTLSPPEASESAARLVLSGPAGGVMGAALSAEAAGVTDAITYDMGGTSTDVSVIADGRPQWTTHGVVDGLPIALPAFDIVTVGAGGGSAAYLDAAGGLRVGPRSMGAAPGPACYGRGGTTPTVTDANVVLGRIPSDRFAGGALRIDPDLAASAIEPLAQALGKSIAETALGIVRITEQNMSRAIRAVTSRRVRDPRRFTLVSFGGAGGLHACALAESLDIRRVLVPPHCGVLSALGMIAAPAVADAARTVVHLGEALDDARLAAEFGFVNLMASDRLPNEETAAVEAYADVRFRGQSHEVKVRVARPTREAIGAAFLEAYAALFGQAPSGRAIEIVALRIRRIGHRPAIRLPPIEPARAGEAMAVAQIIGADCQRHATGVADRSQVLAAGPERGPLCIVDADATTYIPTGWSVEARGDGTLLIDRIAAAAAAAGDPTPNPLQMDLS